MFNFQVSEMDIPFLRIDYGIAQALLMAWKVPIKISEDQWRSFSESDLYHRVQKRKLEIAEEEEVIRKKKPANDENCVTVTNPNPPSEGQKPLVLFSGIQDPEPLKKMVGIYIVFNLYYYVRSWLHLSKMWSTSPIFCAQKLHQ